MIPVPTANAATSCKRCNGSASSGKTASRPYIRHSQSWATWIKRIEHRKNQIEEKKHKDNKRNKSWPTHAYQRVVEVPDWRRGITESYNVRTVALANRREPPMPRDSVSVLEADQLRFICLLRLITGSEISCPNSGMPGRGKIQ
jgi:hypothetical protein